MFWQASASVTPEPKVVQSAVASASATPEPKDYDLLVVWILSENVDGFRRKYGPKCL